MEELLRDLRYAVRSLLRAPTHTTVALLTLALGLGASTAMFAVVDAVLLTSLPYREPDRLLVVSREDPRRGLWDEPVTFALLDRLKAESRTIRDWAGVSTVWNLLVATESGPERTPGSFVSTSFFDLLGVRPLLGRSFTPDDGKPEAESAVVVSHPFWRTHFGGSPDVLGKTFSAGGSFRVVGVMPPGFRFLEEVDVFMPLEPHEWASTSSDRRFLRLVGRLGPGATRDEARAEIQTLGQPVAGDGFSLSVRSIHEEVAGASRPALLLLLAAVFLVLLIACANVQLLLLSRAASREKEIAVRAALGASRASLARQVLVESLLLATAGGLAGLVVASASVALLPAVGFSDLPRHAPVSVNLRALGFALAAALAAAAASSVMPVLFALRARARVPLAQGRATERPEGRRFRSVLALGEMAVAASLLIAAGLLIRSFINLQRVDLGFNPDRLLTLQLSSDIEETAERVRFYRELFERIGALPGVLSVGASTRLPFREGSSARVETEGRLAPETERPTVEVRRASEGYFRAMGIRVVRGRTFDSGDDLDAPPVAVANETAARVLWSGENPIGKRFRIPGPRPRALSPPVVGGGTPTTDSGEVWCVVVGVVGDVKHFGPDSEARPELYLSFDQGPPFGLLLALRTSSEPRSVIPAVREQIRALDPEMGIFGFAPMDALVSDAVARRRYVMRLVTALSGAALLLAAVGIYGVFSSLVLERRREIGVRMAMGARRRDVLRLVMALGAKLALAGILLGVLGASALGRVISSFLFGVAPGDPGTVAAAAALVVGTALAASWVPAMRAARVGPMSILREE